MYLHYGTFNDLGNCRLGNYLTIKSMDVYEI